eukprot:TRINITY_DN6736_c0_g1_i4.p1 TRINITY_DN6736_c0_g1~~TRINITY_DN6736_c0_g1_i4.p1  ORF type:complete len:964 (+),score=155.60 TRINITY_DN6736_c0_g1_i4:115-3006(+)
MHYGSFKKFFSSFQKNDRDFDPMNNQRMSEVKRRAAFRDSRVSKGSILAEFQKQKDKWYVVGSRNIVSSHYVVGLTTFLTSFALCGDDLRMMFTSREFDFTFDVMVGITFGIFAIEIVLSCIGRDDYWLGFFFWLDVMSTATLLLDLTTVADAISGDTEDDNVSSLRGGKTARMGAKAGRVVRVLRLVRIFKLYKALYEAKLRRKQAEESAKRRDEEEEEEEDDWDEADLEACAESEQKLKPTSESRVGRKLSEMTTRRVISLILAMLLVLPLLRADEDISGAAHYGADHVLETFTDYTRGLGSKEEYEQSLLQYVYYHNWFEKDSEYFSALFWVGLIGTNSTAVITLRDKAQLSIASVKAFDYEASRQDALFSFGVMPEEAQTLLASPWTLECDFDRRTRRGISLLSSEIDGYVSRSILCPTDLRLAELMKFYPRVVTRAEHTAFNFAFYFDRRRFTRQEAEYNMATTGIILVLLVVGSLMFSNDANRLVVNPVEKMVERVELIRANPLIATEMADDAFKAEEVAKAAKAKRHRQERAKMLLKEVMTCQVCTVQDSTPNETVILEKTLIKLGSLLALGFGEAGCNIIGQNLGKASASVNAMIPGTRTNCIIGVARIRDFSVATEVLNIKIMTFVNQIAEIVHGVVNSYHGAPNSNLGETFLLIWRLDRVDDRLSRQESTSRLAEMSVVACAVICGALHRSPLIADYRRHPCLQYRLGSSCRVNLTFGLHLGWAIEGAVGSEFKIDASYLSPNVSIATRVENATTIYGVYLIVAQSVVDRCRQRLVAKCRLIDHVVITGSTSPMDLYCVDLDCLRVMVADEHPLTIVWNPRNRCRVRQFLESETKAKWSENYDVASVFETDSTLRTMRKRYTTEFYQLFNMGLRNYLEGEWRVARRLLSCTEVLLGFPDGPSRALLKYMEMPYGYIAPRNWHGVREVDPRARAITDFDCPISRGLSDGFRKRT